MSAWDLNVIFHLYCLSACVVCAPVCLQTHSSLITVYALSFAFDVSVNKLLCLCLSTTGLTNWLVVTTNRQQSPHHRLVPQRGKHHSNAIGWSRPQPTLPQRLPPQSAVVMETAVTTREPHTPGVWRALRPGGSREWSVQVKQWYSERCIRWRGEEKGQKYSAQRERGSIDELQAAVKEKKSQMSSD